MSISAQDTRQRWYAIINPNAGKGKGRKDWDRISRLLKEAGIRYEAVFTRGMHDATGLTCEAIRGGWRRFVVIGGDGTMNQTVNGILGQEEVPASNFRLGIISVGTGNDWGRMYGMSTDYAGAV